MVIVASFGLVVNLLLSPPMLHESRTWKDWVSVVLIVSGISLAIAAVESSGILLLIIFIFRNTLLIPLPTNKRSTPTSAQKVRKSV